MKYLRKVREQDIDLLFNWVNEDSVRKSAFSTAKITYDEHKKWFENILMRDDVKQYIYMCDDEPIGQVRITIDGETAEIDYSICVEERGKGYGKIMLQLLYEQVKKDLPEIKTLIAKVKPDNVASRKVFMNVGYFEQYDVFEMELDDKKDGLNPPEMPNTGGVLLLTNDANALQLFDWIADKCTVHLYSESLQINQLEELKPDLIVSYNYKYLIKEDIIDYMQGNVINLHISYLPWNRGSDPNVWSFIDHTPKGVTIHQVSSGLDKGKILYQKECFFEPSQETFETTYRKLNQEIVQLFKEKWEEIQKRSYILYEQKGKGSYHRRKDLDKLREKISFEWSDNIGDFLKKYKALDGK